MRFKILGPLEVVDGDNGIDLGGPKQRAVLAILILSAGRVVSLDRIIDELWGDEPPARATGTLQAYVSNLRRSLEPGRAPRSPATVLASRPPGYVLQVPPGDIDATVFEELVGRGRDLLDHGRPDEARTMLLEAAALWRGPVLADLETPPFARAEITRLHELHAVAVEARLAADLALGHHAIAAAELEALVRHEPLREQLWELLVVALYRAGRQADALRAYQSACAVLGDELGIEPGPRLAHLEHRVLTHDPALDWTAPVARASEPEVVAAPQPAPAAGNDPLVGRDATLAALTAMLDGRGAVRLVLLSGEAGAGKTRLAAEASRLALERGALVAWGRCSDTPGVPAYWPWVQVVRAVVGSYPAAAAERVLGSSRGDVALILPELAGAPVSRAAADADAARFQLFDSVTAFVDRLVGRRPLLVVIDDLQWADPSSLRLLQFVLTDGRVPGLLLAVTYRDTDDVAGSALHETVTGLAGNPAVARLPVTPLDLGAVRTYIERSTDLQPSEDVVGAVLTRTAGNALFVTELTRLLAAEGRLGDAEAARSAVRFPAELQAVIHRRLARLPGDAHELLTLAAAIGEEFELDVLERVTTEPSDMMLDLVEMALLTRVVAETPRPGTYRFTHALIREVLYDGLSRLRRARLHARVFAALEALWGDDPQPHAASLAFHSFHGAEAGTAEAALRYNTLAATEAADRLAYEQAALNWRQALAALDLARPADREQRYEILMGLSHALRGGGDVEGSQQAVRDAIEVVTRMGDEQRMARAAVGLSRGSGTTWSWRPYGSVDQEAITVLERALVALGPEDTALRAEVMATLAVELYHTVACGRRGAELSAEAVAIAERLADRELLVRMLDMHYVASQGPDRPERRLAISERLIAVDGTAELGPAGLAGHLFRMSSRLELGQLDAADEDLEVAAAAAQRLRQPAMLTQVAWYRAMRAELVGDLDAAERLSNEAFTLHCRTGLWGAWECLSTQLFTLRREQGRLLELEPLIAGLAATSQFAGYHEATALMYLDLGRVDDAYAALGERAAFPSMPRDWSWLFLTCVQAEVCAALGTAEDCVRLHDQLVPFADLLAVIGTGICCWGPVAFFIGRLQEAIGDTAGAAQRYAEAHALAASVGAAPTAHRAERALARLGTRS